ncbi:putative Fe-S oxidoreductase [Thermanaerovibrio velox DSM 12556]|uniref:Putative Fe-S oxidoreductase n=1 Tax=Thermanaerovibrio velox DSM 12556 TaxID=926567 RepID=H0URW6_9BACT|nr:radical SAM protein [Thermanaerovibrio velox]EHM10055.1 putative Fe-S oxidoreductase [Thermanaerovibrio velox DSM 12556]
MPLGLIIDGYVDEPACFGVPPYISPYVRYCAGVFMSHGFEVIYLTVDQIRQEKADHLIRSAEVTVVIAGLTVPGRYRGGSPMTLKELKGLSEIPRRGAMIVGGPIGSGYALKGGDAALDVSKILDVDCIATGDPEAVLDLWIRTKEMTHDAKRDYGTLAKWAEAGAQVVKMHPMYPLIIAELELSRGCDRTDGRCSFCVEGLKAREERSPDSVAAEVRCLAIAGVKAFRFGRCANVLTYGGTLTPKGWMPSPDGLRSLYSSVRSAAPDIKVLHMDNGNPKTIATFPDKSFEALKVIASYNTPGDTISLGLESLHPQVVLQNNLKVFFDQALEAVRIVNLAGGTRPFQNSMPSLLPGLNFLIGLPGENKETINENRRFLEKLLSEGLSVRRINIRRPMTFKSTPLGAVDSSAMKGIRDRDYKAFKDWVRSEVDPVMFSRVAPEGTIIRDVICEERLGNLIFGRPLGSYPPLLGITSSTLKEGDTTDVTVTGAGPRSLSGIPWPLDINNCSQQELQGIPGIGKARAMRLILNRPIAGLEQFKAVLDDPGLADKVAKFFSFPSDEGAI